jgi:predicted AAA+ superfamily ATPase
VNNLLGVVERQRNEIEEKLKQRIIEREVPESFKRNIEKEIIKIITGVRRSGKSTLAILLLKGKNFGYLNFDEKELIEQRLDDLLNALKEVYGDTRFILLDEIQNVNGWELWVNSLQRLGYNLIITGSNAKLLSKELATHVTGRYIELENFPFSFGEFLAFKNFLIEELKNNKEKEGELKRMLREYLSKGGFPEYIIKELDQSYLQTLFHSIIFTDVVKRWNVKYSSKIEDLARYLISISSNEYSATKLRNLLGFRSTLTVEKYIEYIKESYLIFTLERFSFKAKQFLKAPKKVYSIDNGLKSAISQRINEEIGSSMENLVFIELKHRGLKENKDIFYLKLNNGEEVDFLIKEGTAIKQLIQVTYASGRDEIEKREIKALEKASTLLDCRDLLCITWDYEDELKDDGKTIRFIPLWKWLLTK